ncbi:MAG TPA: hypothetical protein VGZ22_20245 [Isosphaeraceae bacterium]|nr:hypothetical protein [Isosphaeraceae bacterium]
MDPHTTRQPRTPALDTPEALLDALREHPEWTESERQQVFDRLVARFDPDRLVEAIGKRLDDLRGHDGEAVLQLLEALATPRLLDALAHALQSQPDLAADRAWEALIVLDDAGVLEDYPALLERWQELNEAIDDEGSLDELVAQIEDDLDELWVPLQAIATVEPEVRAEIVGGIGQRRGESGPGVVEFLRLLAHSHDPLTRSAALDGLARSAPDDPHTIAAWATIAADHADPDVAARAHRWLGSEAEAAIAMYAGPQRPLPRLERCLVTALDGQGQGSVVLVAEHNGQWAAAAFLCDVLRGVREVAGQLGRDREPADALLAELAARPERDVVAGSARLALGLLAGSLLICDATTPPALRFWLERTAGPGLRPEPFAGLIDDWDPASLPREQWDASARAVLASCPDWLDDSPLTYELAEEITLREAGSPPSPTRDAAIYRYLFEHHLQNQLELYRRMLFWMSSFWQAADDEALGRSALALAWQLSEPQHSIPGHPFLVALTTRSLASAQAVLQSRTG